MRTPSSRIGFNLPKFGLSTDQWSQIGHDVAHYRERKDHVRHPGAKYRAPIDGPSHNRAFSLGYLWAHTGYGFQCPALSSRRTLPVSSPFRGPSGALSREGVIRRKQVSHPEFRTLGGL